jgi:CO/xanthine dehydrogenase FAD-binding subunit
MTLLALGGSVEITGPSGLRTVPADDFFTGPFESVLSPDELLSAVRVPRGGSVPWGYQKFVRRANDWAIVGVAAYDGRVALASMGGTPLRALATEEALRSGASAAEAAALAALPRLRLPRRLGLPQAPSPRPHPPCAGGQNRLTSHGTTACPAATAG